MKKYSQRDTRWANKKLGHSSTSTIGAYGCFLTALSMIAEQEPNEVNEILKDGGGFIRDLIVSSNSAIALGIPYNGISKTKPSYNCIAEVDMSPAPGKQQHFVVWMKDKIVDPWTGRIEVVNKYPIINYRLFEFEDAKETCFGYEEKHIKNFEKIFKKASELTDIDAGKRPNNRETDEICSGLDDLEDCSSVEVNELEDRIQELETDTIEQFNDITILNERVSKKAQKLIEIKEIIERD